MKKSNLLFIFIIIFSIFLSGCSNTSELESVVDPAYTEKVESILVMFRTGDVKITKEVETSIVDNLKKKNVDSYASYRLIPLTRQYSQEEFNEKVSNVIVEKNIDSILFVTVKNIKTDKHEINTHNQNSGNAVSSFVQGYAQGLDNSQYETLEMNIDIRLYNTKKDGIAWRGTISGTSSNFTSDTGKENIISIMEKSAKKLVDNLSKNNLI